MAAAYQAPPRQPPGNDLPHPHLADHVNHNILQAEVEGGAYLDRLSARCMLEIETAHRCYKLLNRGDGTVLLWGHPEFCPSPVEVSIAGSTWGGSMLKVGFIGRGMHLEFRHPRYRTPIRTSRIRDIRELNHSS